MLGSGRRYSAGVILESWRLWEGLDRAATARRVSDWRLDSDYFELEEAPSIAVVIAQGAPMIADALERLAGSGASHVVRLGTTGGLQHDLHVGDVMLPFVCLRGDGTSRYYAPPETPALASLPLVDALVAELSPRFERRVRRCIGWTTDGRWVESDAEIRDYSEMGVAAVDMESAALFSAAAARSVRAASISIVADLPILHIGADFKGLPGTIEEWQLVQRQASTAFEGIVRVLSGAPAARRC